MRLSLILLPFLLAAQSDSPIQSRIRSAPLTPAVRDSLLQAVSAKDYAKIESALTVAPDGATLALLGAIEFVGGRLQPAAGAFQRADALTPLDDKDRFTYAMALATLGETDGARTQLDRLQKLHPDQSLYLYWLARLDYFQRRYDDAVAKLQRAVKLDPGSPRIWDNLGLNHDMLGQSGEAQQAFEKAVELNRRLKTPSAWPPMNFGALLFRLQKLAEAETSLREALRYEPQFAQAHYHLGRVLEKTGDNTKAIEELQTAARLDPAMAEAEYTLSQIFRRLGRNAEAAKALEEYKKRRGPTAGPDYKGIPR
jgi:tetratricopeptide (TPR) repeat protein